MLPGTFPVLAEKPIRCDDNDHVELIHQGDLLSSVSPRKAETIVACPDGPPLIPIPDVVEVPP